MICHRQAADSHAGRTGSPHACLAARSKDRSTSMEHDGSSCGTRTARRFASRSVPMGRTTTTCPPAEWTISHLPRVSLLRSTRTGTSLRARPSRRSRIGTRAGNQDWANSPALPRGNSPCGASRPHDEHISRLTSYASPDVIHRARFESDATRASTCVTLPVARVGGYRAKQSRHGRFNPRRHLLVYGIGFITAGPASDPLTRARLSCTAVLGMVSPGASTRRTCGHRK